MKTVISVNGKITAPEDAVVPVLDRGFLYGDSVYEVLWWHHGTLIQEQDHLDRLRESGRRIYLEIDVPRDTLVAQIDATCEAAGVGRDDDAYVRLMVTRGAGPLGLGFEEAPPLTVIVVVAPANRPTRAEFEKGLRAALVERRRNSARALDPAAKTGNYLNNVLALHEARLQGADEALMLNESGDVTEATTANVYVIADGRLRTPPLEAGILRGTTRTRILDLCAENGIDAREERVTPADLRAADEVFISSSVRGILPVVSIDGHDVGSGEAGPTATRVRALFEAAADAEAHA